MQSSLFALTCGILAIGALTSPAAAQVCTQTPPGGVPTEVPCGPPLADQAIGGCTNPSQSEAAWTSGNVNDRLFRTTLTGSTTQCMDGSPAIFYVRSATSPEHSDDWLIILEGGGSGFDPLGTLDSGMLNRWAGGNPATNCSHLLSTDLRDNVTNAPVRDGIVDSRHHLAIQLGGMMHPDPSVSHFAEWNWVYLNYCSSDLWTGTNNDVDLYDVSIDVGGTIHQGFRFDFNGHNIIDGVLQVLKSGSFTTDSHNLPYTINDLDDARTVFLAGESAGGGGVRNNLDFVASQLPDASVRGYLGAAHSPIFAQPGDGWWIDNDGNGIHDDEDGAINQVDQVLQIGGFFDESCRQANPDSEHHCLVLSTLEPHLTTPHMLRQNFRDRLLVPSRWSAADFRTGTVRDYDTWIANGSPWFFAANRSDHYVITNTSRYQSQTMALCRASAGLPIAPQTVTLNDWIALGDALDLAPTSLIWDQIYDDLRVLDYRRWVTRPTDCDLARVEAEVSGQWVSSARMQAECSGVAQNLGGSTSSFPDADTLSCYAGDVLEVTCSWGSSDPEDTVYLRTNAPQGDVTHLGKNGKSKSWELSVFEGVHINCEFDDYD